MKVLRFKINGKWIFTKKVKHPGTKANPFFERASKKGEKRVHKFFENAIEKTLDFIKNR